MTTLAAGSSTHSLITSTQADFVDQTQKEPPNAFLKEVLTSSLTVVERKAPAGGRRRQRQRLP